MSALSHQREVGGPINSIIPFLTDNFKDFFTIFGIIFNIFNIVYSVANRQNHIQIIVGNLF